MAKRQQLDYDGETLTQNLKRSAGHGVDAFFPAPDATQPATVAPARSRDREEPPAEFQAPRAPARASTRARTQAPIEDVLQRAVAAKRHLSSFTFRFGAEELARLDQVTAELSQEGAPRQSKNDVVRLALNWLLHDYETKREKSMLARVLGRA